MNDFAKKLVLLGMGLASFTEEKSKQIINELLERGEKYNETDSKLAEFLKAADKSTQDFENKIENILKDLISKLNLATKDDVEALKKEVEELKNRG